MKICIAGAGAIGCTLAARLADSSHDISLLARGENLTNIQKHGIQLKDLDGEHHANIKASDKADELGKQDLILVCTKAPALASILTLISPMIGKETIVIPVVNGIPWWYFYGAEGRFKDQSISTLDPDNRLQTLLPHEHILGCVVFITAARESYGKVTANNPHLIVLGEINHQMTERLETIRTVFEEVGIELRSCSPPQLTALAFALTHKPSWNSEQEWAPLKPPCYKILKPACH